MIGQTTGRLTTSRYKVATVFVDHYSDIDYVHVQETTSAEDTLEAKARFERFAQERGVVIRHYHADNGIFASNGFRESVRDCGQTISFCGVGAHHQNGIAERRIQDLTDSARASMAHAAHKNPAVTANLWPYALCYASYVRRLFPKEGEALSPDEKFSASPVRPTTKFLHPFGCPVYVLKANLQSGGPHSKWDDRSRVGVYLGPSRHHASNVSLVLNPATGYVSPQFHCVYDDRFETPDKDANFHDKWAEKAGLAEQRLNALPDNDLERAVIPRQFQFPFDEREVAPNEPQPALLDEQERVLEPEGVPPDLPNEAPVAEPEPVQNVPRATTRSGRQIRPTARLQESELMPRLRSFAMIALCMTMALFVLDDGTFNEHLKLFAYPASIADNDTMYIRQAMQQEDRYEFLQAMIKEVEDHTNRAHWRITTVDEMKRKGYAHKPISGIWSFKRKRNPAGDITKYKARFCCHGGQTIKGVHYEESFSPVVSWATVRLMFTLAAVNNWHARQIDFVLAFPQADVKKDVYMYLPEKFRLEDGKLILDESAPHPTRQRAVVKLIKNIYGLVDASYTWHQHIKKGLTTFGFKTSEVDPCLFYKGTLIFILYVDDAICLTPKKKEADSLISRLERKGFILTDEGPLSAYLGVQVKKLSENSIEITQPGFIQRVIQSVHLKDDRIHDTPANEVMHRDLEGAQRKTDFHYRSVIGQLNYLAGTTRPDIQFAVHQCARFCENPKAIHERGVKRIIRYLKRTADKGMILTIDTSKGIDCYVDADYAGGYIANKATTARDCLSRTGYVVKYANCPIIWCSKLQGTIALSTTEAEYMALSMAMREVIFLMNLIGEMRFYGIDLLGTKPTIKCDVHEDNSGAIELAKLPKLRPRTKHIAIQYHHFRSWTVRGLDGQDPKVAVQHISTNEQIADIMTKALPKLQFEYLRKRLIGW